MGIVITSDNFESEVLNSKIPVLLDFWAIWCGPCQMLIPTLDEVSNEFGEKLKICKVNVDDNGELATKYNVMSIPTLILIKDGKSIAQNVGNIAKKQLIDFINNNI